MLDPRRLRVLKEVAARGTMAAAGEALCLTPPAVSQQIAALERETGMALLVRHGRGVRLTDAGRVLVGHTELVLAGLEAAEADLLARCGQVTGTLAVGVFPTAARALMPGTLRRLRAAYPALRVVCRQMEPHLSLPALANGDLDLAIAHEYDLVPVTLPPRIERRALFREPMLLALSDAEAVEAGAEVDVACLKGARWAMGEPDSACGRFARSLCRAAGFEPVVDHLVDDFTVTLALVASCLAVAVLPELAITETPPGVRLRPIRGRPLRSVFIAIRASSARHPAVRALIEGLS